MTELRLIDLYQLNVGIKSDENGLLRIEGHKNILTSEFVSQIRDNKDRLIEELLSVCEHVNVVNVFSEDNSSNKSLLPGPLEGLEITSHNIVWINESLLFKSWNQRLVILKEYRAQYEQGAAVVPKELSHKKQNAGTFAANSWLRKFLEKQRSIDSKN